MIFLEYIFHMLESKWKKVTPWNSSIVAKNGFHLTRKPHVRRTQWKKKDRKWAVFGAIDEVRYCSDTSLTRLEIVLYFQRKYETWPLGNVAC